MAPKIRERIINWAVNGVVTVAAILLTFTLNSNYQESRDIIKEHKEIEKKIDKKLDKTEFSDYKKDHNERHARELESNDKFLEQLDKRFKEQDESIQRRLDDFKDFLNKNGT